MAGPNRWNRSAPGLNLAKPPPDSLDQIRVAAKAGQVDGGLHRRIQERTNDRRLPYRLASIVTCLSTPILEPIDLSLLEKHRGLPCLGDGLLLDFGIAPKEERLTVRD